MSPTFRLRSDNWFGPDTPVDLRAHHSGKLVNATLTAEELFGTDHFLSGQSRSGRRPLIGICRFGGDLNPCQAMQDIHLGDRVAEGIRSAGGIPIRFDTAPPLGEPLARPTAMYLRNLTALTLVETIIANPLDGIVLMTGCDKTVPAGLMAALFANIPTIVSPAGPMLNGYYHGEQAASGVHLWKSRERLAAGEIDEDELLRRSHCAQPSAGHCMSMGTASTLNSLAEALGLTLLGASAIPSPYAERAHASFRIGGMAVAMVMADRKPRDFVTRRSFLNAVAVNSAIGGSTNAIIHLTAAAKMGRIDLTLEDFHQYGRHIPLIVDVKPSGRFLMEEYYRAGGLPAVLRQLAEAGHIDDSAGWCSGRSLAQELADADPYVDSNVIRPLASPLQAEGGIAILRGNLAPDGAVIKVSAVADQRLLRHRGQAVVFDSIEEYQARIDDPALKVQPDNVLVLRNCGPLGYPGMPEVGNVRLPGYLLKQGVKAMVTVSDARMSGTAYGCHVLHVCPESAIGGPLALVETGDWIVLDVAKRQIRLDLTDGEMAARAARATPALAKIHSPWGLIHSHPALGSHQADKGAYLKLFDDPALSAEAMEQAVNSSLRRQH